jgi:hypothetical protein
MDRRPVADFGGGGAFGGERGAVAVLGLAPLVEGAGYVDPVPAPPLGGRDLGRAQGLGMLDGGAVVAEDLRGKLVLVVDHS